MPTKQDNGHFLLPKPTISGGMSTNSYSNKELRLTVSLLFLKFIFNLVVK